MRDRLPAGALLYLVGPLGITVTRNVPLNNRLASTAPQDANSFWPRYQRDWQFWNHLRSYAGIIAIALLAAGLASRGLQPGM